MFCFGGEKQFFRKKDVQYYSVVQYNLRTKELCKLPSVSSQRYGLNSLSLRGSLLWSAIDDEIKLSPSLEKFMEKYVAGMALTENVYLQRISFYFLLTR